MNENQEFQIYFEFVVLIGKGIKFRMEGGRGFIVKVAQTNLIIVSIKKKDVYHYNSFSLKS